MVQSSGDMFQAALTCSFSSVPESPRQSIVFCQTHPLGFSVRMQNTACIRQPSSHRTAFQQSAEQEVSVFLASFSIIEGITFLRSILVPTNKESSNNGELSQVPTFLSHFQIRAEDH